MTEFFREMATRIFAGGIICCAAMMLAGDGAKKEIVRLCCACMMIIFVLSPIKGASFNLNEITGGVKDAETQINSALNDAQTRERNSIAQAVAEYIAEQAGVLGLDCRAEVDYSVNEQNVFCINAITVLYRAPAEPQALEELKKIIARDCGVGAGQIAVEEESGHEN